MLLIVTFLYYYLSLRTLNWNKICSAMDCSEHIFNYYIKPFPDKQWEENPCFCWKTKIVWSCYAPWTAFIIPDVLGCEVHWIFHWILACTWRIDSYGPPYIIEDLSFLKFLNGSKYWYNFWQLWKQRLVEIALEARISHASFLLHTIWEKLIFFMRMQLTGPCFYIPPLVLNRWRTKLGK